MLVELSELTRIRVERDLTYDELAAQIGVTRDSLYRWLTRRSSRPNERNEHKIRRWLDSQRTRSAA